MSNNNNNKPNYAHKTFSNCLLFRFGWSPFGFYTLCCNNCTNFFKEIIILIRTIIVTLIKCLKSIVLVALACGATDRVILAKRINEYEWQFWLAMASVA